jgi:hypothetical protein
VTWIHHVPGSLLTGDSIGSKTPEAGLRRSRLRNGLITVKWLSAQFSIAIGDPPSTQPLPTQRRLRSAGSNQQSSLNDPSLGANLPSFCGA